MKPDKSNWNLWIGGGALIGGLLPILLYRLLPGNALPEGQASGFHCATRIEEWLVIITAFGVKPAYMLISLASVIWLWRQRSPDLVALRWGLMVFWLGEGACAVNFVVFQGYSNLWEYFHNFGMAVGFSFVTYALLEGMDRRLIKYSAAKDRCAALSLCRACIKYDTGCALRVASDVYSGHSCDDRRGLHAVKRGSEACRVRHERYGIERALCGSIVRPVI